ncbi:hypothetical protein [Jeotgalibacillus proteolyticus]|uniref:hypothetical protein n=1 Tax=Jeotgalibacillus proteolyticus TaxID=2082395 RepID=UPI003CF14A3A
MAIVSTKVGAVLLASVVTMGATGFYFTEGETVDDVKLQLAELRDKVVQYDYSENALLEKIGLIKADATEMLTDANGKIIDAKTEINNLKADKSFLETQIDGLNTDVANLTAERDQLVADLDAANDTIDEKNAAIDELNSTIDSKNAEIETLQGQVASLETQLANLQAEYDQLEEDYNALVAENTDNKAEAERANAEVQKANEKVAELEGISQEVEEDTDSLDALTQEELDAIGTENTPDVFDAELVVKNLNLTYIQDGQSEEFKAAHPDLDIQPGERVWRITNDNEFKVYVEYVKGTEDGELVANPSQTFYMTESGGSMIIKWQDENGVWKQTVKAGA